MAPIDQYIRQNDLVCIGPRCREQHIALATSTAGTAEGLLAAGIGNERGSYRIERRRRQGHQVLYTLAGEGWFIDDRGSHALRPGQFVLTRDGSPQCYGVGPRGRWDILWLVLDPRHQGWSRLLVRHENGVRAATGIEPVTGLVRALVREGMTGEAELLHHLCRALVRYVRRDLGDADPTADPAADPAQGDRYAAVLRGVVERVRADPAAPWSVGHLCAISGLDIGNDHFTRLCRRRLGMTPMRMVAEQRLEQAATLLISSDYDLGTIAGLVGYATPFALSNAFQHRFGIRPSTYRGRIAHRRQTPRK